MVLESGWSCGTQELVGMLVLSADNWHYSWSRRMGLRFGMGLKFWDGFEVWDGFEFGMGLWFGMSLRFGMG